MLPLRSQMSYKKLKIGSQNVFCRLKKKNTIVVFTAGVDRRGE